MLIPFNKMFANNLRIHQYFKYNIIRLTTLTNTFNIIFPIRKTFQLPHLWLILWWLNLWIPLAWFAAKNFNATVIKSTTKTVLKLYINRIPAIISNRHWINQLKVQLKYLDLLQIPVRNNGQPWSICRNIGCSSCDELVHQLNIQWGVFVIIVA